jgi:SH3-like domain-containing protein
MRRGIFAALVAASALFSLTSAVADTTAIGSDSNLPVPRFVSLKTEGANGRHGPGLEHRIDWIYERAGLPLQVTGESGPWRRVRDPDGAEVWMHAQNLEQRRTIYVAQATALRRNAHSGSQVVAYLAPGVVGAVTACEGDWRRVAVGGRVGWVDNAALWGGDCAGLGASRG